MNRPLLLGSVITAASLSSTLLASPLMSVGSGTPNSWSAAITGGYVAPAGSPLSGPASQYYASLATTQGLAGVQQVVPTLTPDVPVSDGTTSQKALVMSWSAPAAPNTMAVAGWNFTYHADPNFLNTDIFLSALAPPGIDALSLELVDTSGMSEGWFTSTPDLYYWDSNYHIDTASKEPQGPFTSFIADQGFDITHVSTIRFEEASDSSAVFPVPDPTGLGGAWNAWGSVRVVPAPLAWFPFLIGSLARRRRRQVRA